MRRKVAAKSQNMAAQTRNDRIHRWLCSSQAGRREEDRYARIIFGRCDRAGIAARIALTRPAFESKTNDGVLEAARVSEGTHSANTTQTSQTDSLDAKVDLLFNNLMTNDTKSEEPSAAPKKVTFTQAVVATETTNRSTRERSYSPATKSPSGSPVRSSGEYESSVGLPRHDWAHNNLPLRAIWTIVAR